MPKNENWDKIPLTELLDTIVDNRGKSVPTSETGFPLIATNCIKHSSIYPMFENIRYVSDETLKTWFRAELKPNDILFVNKGSPGRVCLVPNPVPFCAAQDMVGLRCNPKKVYYKYLFAYLRTPIIQRKIENYHVGIMIPHFKKSDMDNLLIELPEMPIQRKIGDLYLLLSEKIELNNKISADLESLAKTIYDYWFLQFEFPDANGKPYKSSGGRMVWNEALKREVPEGWEVKQIGDVISTILGGTPNTDIDEYWTNGTINWLSSTEMTNNVIIRETTKITEDAVKNSATKLMPRGTVVLSITRYIRPAILAIDSCANQSVVGLLESNIYKKEFLYPYLQYQIRTFYTLRTGALQPHINKDTIKSAFILRPTDEVLTNYYSITSPIYEAIINKALESKELTTLRDFLLPQLMNRQVTFKDEKECPA
jgi:type I restriction enzyme S subunit